MQVADLVRVMETIAPLSFAEPWDRVGLHVGRLRSPLRLPIVLTIDLNEAVLAEAEKAGAGAIVAYHPPIWEPLKRLTDMSPKERLLLRAAELGIAIYSPHTALDAVPGGMTDWLCEGLGEVEGKVPGDCRALKSHSSRPATAEVKLVTFVPLSEVEKVRNSLATAGAGIIGAYTVCSFASPGTGTFFGDESSHPSVGRRGTLESVSELRLEMVCSKAALPLAIETLRQFHPYEEPPIDVYELLPKPTRGIGSGRRVALDHPAPLRVLAERLKKHIGRSVVRVAAADLDKPVSVIGVCCGAGAELASVASSEGCEVFVTGEMRHHEVTACLDRGLSIILGEHTSTERGYLPRLAKKIESLLPGSRCLVSQRDVDPLTAV
ncbi:MAG: Nif3-like dinuclear metal center hexameric protein [Phycisphaerales bacterium]|nr:Nif3-like dinuclear metal center hexameric protein [Phycisphaerales bacterium]